MNSKVKQEDSDLEQRLRTYYENYYGETARPAQVWEQVVPRLGAQHSQSRLQGWIDQFVRQSSRARSHRLSLGWPIVSGTAVAVLLLMGLILWWASSDRYNVTPGVSGMPG